jgi:hypothetical protein
VAIDESFAEAWLNSTHRVFGWELRPFSIWHKLILNACGSPVLSGASDINISHIYQAAIVCRLGYPDQPKSHGKLGDWIKFLRVPLSRPRKEADSFLAYLNDYLSNPEFWEDRDGGGKKKGGPPDELSLVTSLMLLGFSEKEAWDMPIGKANWYSASYSAWKGGNLDFITQKEKEMQKNWSSIQAKLEAAKAEFIKKKQEEKNEQQSK